MKNRNKFIHYEILASSLVAGFMHAKIYNSKINLDKKALEEKKEKMRQDLKQYLINISKDYYINKVDSEKHINNIVKLKNLIQKKHKDILMEEKFRFGIAQKLFNLYLKYLWTLGWIVPPPPHCPIDSLISKRLDCEYKFTKSDNVDEYKKVIEKASVIAQKNNFTIAEWELNTFLEENYQKLIFGNIK